MSELASIEEMVRYYTKKKFETDDDNYKRSLKMDEDQVGFRLTLADAEEFFRRCMARKADTLEDRMAILKELQKELRALYLNSEDLKRLMKTKNVLRITKAQEEE